MPGNFDRIERDIDLSFRFTRKPMPITAELRPDWKMASLVLILQLSSRGGKSSLKRLHVLNWAMRSRKFREEFEGMRDNPLPLFGFSVRFEPAFSRAIDFAAAEQFVSWVNGNRLQITAKGRKWAAQMLEDESFMRDEREFLSRIGKSVTEDAAARVLGGRMEW